MTVSGLLVDPLTEDILLNPDGTIWVKRQGAAYEVAGYLGRSQAESAICTVATMQVRYVNYEHPILETELPGSGARFSAILPPVTTGPVFAIRLRARKVYSLADYERAGVLGQSVIGGCAGSPDEWIGRLSQETNATHASVIRAAIKQRLNIVVAGGTASGKTTLANAIIAEMGELTPDDRVVTIEDTAELQCDLRNSVALHSIDSGEHQVSMLECLKAALRLRPTRIIVGEVRGKEAHALLKAWNTGHPGGLATIHANDARSSLSRLESLVAEASESSGASQQKLIAEAVQVIVYIDQYGPAGRRVKEIALVRGWDSRQKIYEVEYL
jgi:type IV secretion system protein VirB11